MKNHLISLLLFFRFVCVEANLICNGDFESYPNPSIMLLFDGSKNYYGLIPSNLSCWYQSNFGSITVLNQSFGQMSKLSRLADVLNIPYSLCQKVQLQINATYNLSLDVGMPKQVSSATAFVYVNKKFAVSGVSTNYLVSTKLVFIFTANSSVNQICINGSVVQKHSMFGFVMKFTPMIGNVTLILIGPPPIIVNTIDKTITTNTSTSTNTTNASTPTSSATNNISMVNTTNTINNTNKQFSSNSSNTTSTVAATNGSYTANPTNTPNITNAANSTDSNEINYTGQINTTASSAMPNYSLASVINSSSTTNNTSNVNISQLNTSVQGNIAGFSSLGGQSILVNQAYLENQSELNSYRSQVYIQLYLDITKNEDEGWVRLCGNFSYGQQLFEHFSKFSDIYLEGEKQSNVIYAYFNQNQTISVTAYVERTYDTKNAYATLPPFFNDQLQVNIVVYLDGQPIYIFIVPGSSIQMVNNLQPYTTKLISAVAISYTFLKTFFVSYFVMNLFSFYSITLMYNFVCLYSQPSFSHNALEKLAQIFYVRNSLVGFIQNLFPESRVKQAVDFSSFLNSTSGRQRIRLFYRGYSWFGNMGITYNFLQNNFQTLVMLALIGTRLLLLRFILSQLCPKLVKAKFETKQCLEIILSQFICLCPFMTISALETILNSGYFDERQKLNMFLQVMTFFIIFLAPLSLFIINAKIMKSQQFRQSRKKVKKFHSKATNQQNNEKALILFKIKRDLIKTRKPLSLNFISPYYSSLNILIPALTVFQSQMAFFIVSTFYILILFILYMSHFKHLTIKERIFKGTNCLVLCTFHGFFLLIFVTDQIDAQQRSEMGNACLTAGIALIFLVFIGGFLDLLDFIIGIIAAIIKSVIRLADFVKKFINKRIASSHEDKRIDFKNTETASKQRENDKFIRVTQIVKKQKSHKNLSKAETKQSLNKITQQQQILPSRFKPNVKKTITSFQSQLLWICKEIQ